MIRKAPGEFQAGWYGSIVETAMIVQVQLEPKEILHEKH